MPSNFLLNQLGDIAIREPEGGFLSRGEEVVYYELVSRIGRDAFRYQVYFHDVPTTAKRDERNAEFVLPALGAVILVNSEFTHPDPEADRFTEQLFAALGYRTYWLWDYEILEDMGGNVRDALNKIPGLGFFGQAVSRPRPARDKRRYGQPPRIVRFSSFKEF